MPALLVLLVAGCGGILENQRPADEHYWLEPLAEEGSQPLHGLGLQFELNVVPGLDSERVLTLEPDARLSQLGKARWADSLPDVLQSVIGRSLVNQGAELNTFKQGARCRLEVQVQEFFARGAPPGSVTARMTGQLDCRGESLPLRLEQTVTAGPDHASVIAALQRALDQSTRELVNHLDTALVRDAGE